MTTGEWLAIAGVLVALGGLITRVEMLREDVKKLREWRHDVGEKPGYAAFERLTATNQRVDDTNRRVDRLERRAFNGQRHDS